jgi:hypothetical protein
MLIYSRRGSTPPRKRLVARPRASSLRMLSISGGKRCRTGRADMTATIEVFIVQKCDELGIRRTIVEGELDETAQAGFRRLVIDAEPALCCAERGIGILEDRGVEAVLAAKVVIEHPLVRAGAPRDIVDPRAAIPIPRERCGRGSEYAAFAQLRAAIAPPRPTAPAGVIDSGHHALFNNQSVTSASRAGLAMQATAATTGG